MELSSDEKRACVARLAQTEKAEQMHSQVADHQNERVPCVGAESACCDARKGASQLIDRLSAKEIEELAGCQTPRRQVNVLKSAGIYCFINASKEVVVLRAWAERAGASPERTAGKNLSTAKKKTELQLPFHRLEELNENARH